MKLSHWIAIFSFETFIAYWVVSRRGAGTIGSLTSFFTLGLFSERWSSDGLRAFVGITWVASLIYFILGVFNPESRLASALPPFIR